MSFQEWFKKRMAEAAAGGATTTANIAGYARPIFGSLIRRKKIRMYEEIDPKELGKMKIKDFVTTPVYFDMDGKAIGTEAEKLEDPTLFKTHEKPIIMKVPVELMGKIYGMTEKDIESYTEVVKNDMQNQIRLLLDSDQFSMLFMWYNDIFGTDEVNRVIFSNMKSNKDLSENHFTGINISSAILTGKSYPRIFYKTDLPDIKVVDKQFAYYFIVNSAVTEN